MPAEKTKAQHDADRTDILRYLNECGFQPVTPKSVLIYLDDKLTPLSLDSIAFHLRYMCDREWVDIGEEKIVGQVAVIRWARITADGVDELDRRMKTQGEVA